jgi:hypothetical protein
MLCSVWNLPGVPQRAFIAKGMFDSSSTEMRTPPANLANLVTQPGQQQTRISRLAKVIPQLRCHKSQLNSQPEILSYTPGTLRVAVQPLKLGSSMERLKSSWYIFFGIADLLPEMDCKV